MDSAELLRVEDCEPNEWFVVFHRTASRWWVKWLAWGRYHHVSAFGQVRKTGFWLFFDLDVSRLRVLVVANDCADAILGKLVDEGCVVRMPAPRGADDRMKLKPGTWCVPAVAHLLGLKTCALRPDALLRHCLANGGTIVVPDGDENPEHRERP